MKRRDDYQRMSVYTDGAAKGNPGPSGAGAVLQANGHTRRFAKGLVDGTNNVAEYEAMLLGVTKAKEAGATHLRAYTDSELVVKQLNGLYAVNNPVLKRLRDQIRAVAAAFAVCEFAHVFREDNFKADLAANKGVGLEPGQILEF